MQLCAFIRHVVNEQFRSPAIALQACCKVQQDVVVLDVPSVFAETEIVVRAAVRSCVPASLFGYLEARPAAVDQPERVLDVEGAA